jgi:hypothetical protein
LNNTYFNRLDESVRNAVVNMTIPVIDCQSFHTLYVSGNQAQGIGGIAQRVHITNINARVWIPHAAEVGVPWNTDNSAHTAGFPNSLAVLHWMAGAGTTSAAWNNSIRFSHFPLGHGSNPSRAVADAASAARVARCDNGVAQMWWTRCPGNQVSGGGSWGVVVTANGLGTIRRVSDTAWLRPTMGFPSTLAVNFGVGVDPNTITISAETSGTIEIPAGAEITITSAGTVNLGVNNITLNIGENATVNWLANVTSTVAGGNLVTIIGNGTFNMTGGSIENNYTGIVVLAADANSDAWTIDAVNNTNIYVTGGAVRAASAYHYAIRTYNGRVTVTPPGVVYGRILDGTAFEVPPTGIADMRFTIAAMLAFFAISVGLWGKIISRRKPHQQMPK